ncbi:MAG: sigma-70 family RNA polymerase sigma factor [Planctomycetes bacterium]|nr:sigma-70 family RNA polymerase sigma factor [Planctomycetota bacterium]
MSPAPPNEENEVERLLSQTAWVRGLALAVARDSHAAEDVAQDALVAALRRPPAVPDRLRGWLVRVVRNLVRLRARTDARREAREQVAARPERTEDPSLALERLETQEALLRAVRELREPYRTTVLLRWFEGLEPVEIARRSGIPVRTVHTRVTRALALLRERLDRRSGGDRSAWMSAWIPLLRRTAGPWPWIVAMDAKIKLALAGAVAAGALATLWVAAAPSGETASAPAPADGVRAPKPATPDGDRPTVPTRSPVEAPALGSTRSGNAPPPAESAVPDLEGLVLDARGTPLPAFAVEFRTRVGGGAAPAALTDARGRFRLAAPDSAGTIAPASDAWTPVLEPRVWKPRGGGLHVLVVAPRLALEGVVVDEGRAPVEGAEVRCVSPDLRSRIEQVLDGSTNVEWKARSDADGRFRIPDAPSLEGARLETSATHFERDARALASSSRLDLEIVLKPLSDPGSHLRGRVVDARGGGVEGAWVALGRSAVKTDFEGRFDIDLLRDGEGRTLRALKPGFLPAELECAAASPRDAGAWPDPLLLALDRPALSISGRVADGGGAPVADVRVGLLDRTPFAEVEIFFGSTLFKSAAGVEPLLAGRPFSPLPGTGEDGRFEVPGLLPRAYRLLVFDRRRMEVRVTEPIPAGTTGLEVRLPAEGRLSRIAGRVLDRRGRPVEGASVLPALPPLGQEAEARRDLRGEPVQTDAEGRFEFRDISRRVDRLSVSVPPNPESREIPLAGERDLEAIEVRVERPCHLQVDLTGSSFQADSLEVLDGSGRPLNLALYEGTSSISAGSLWLTDGRSRALAVSEEAQTLVLRAGGKEVARVALYLQADELNVVRP